MATRREFLEISLKGIALAGMGMQSYPSEAKSGEIKLTILHTNDMHSRIDPFPMDGGKYQGLGGMARRAAIIQKVRNEEENVLLFDSGDIFQGTAYFNFYGGELEFKLMSQMGYDASTMGNHDFDAGLDGFYKQLPNASFPFLVSNYDFKETILRESVQPYKVFEKGTIKVGVFGLGIELDGLVPRKHFGKTIYKNPIEAGREMVQELKHNDCDLIVCLSHLGYKYSGSKVSDHVIAKEVEGIDLILGGHTHTFLEKPEILTSTSGKEVLINQVGFGGIKIGRIDYIFQRKLKRRGAISRAYNVS